MVLDLRYIAVAFFASVTGFVIDIYSLQKAVAAGGKRQGTPQRSADPNPREYARACAPASACSVALLEGMPTHSNVFKDGVAHNSKGQKIS